MDYIFFEIIKALGCLPNEFIVALEFILCAAFLLIFFHYFSYAGVYGFNIVATILGNIQILREVEYFFQPEKVALGSIVFAMTFTGSDIITEHYGAKIARGGVMASFVAQAFFVSSMLIILTYTPYDDSYYSALSTIFITSPRFLVASIVAYLSSQMLDIYVFSLLKNYLGKRKWLWFRSGIAVIIASLTDNIIFSLIAWKLLAVEDISLNKLIFTYILGTYWFKLLINLCATPLIYLSYITIKCQK